MRRLRRAHPALCFLYMLSVLGITVFTRHPILTLESAAGAVLLLILSKKQRALPSLLLLSAAAAAANFLLVHKGASPLFFVGNTAFTLEALIYGAEFGLMLAAVCCWSVCGTEYLTSDKYVYIFGRLLPSAGLVLSCALRFVPLFIQRTREFALSQNASTVREYIRAFSSSISYSAEQSMISAQSMRARGYGTAKRTSFALYRLTPRTIAMLSAVAAVTGACVVLICLGAGGFYYYPAVSAVRFPPRDTALFSAFGLLCLTPSAALLTAND